MFNRFFFSLIFISGCDQKFTNCRTAELYENPNIKAFLEKLKAEVALYLQTYVCIKLKTVYNFWMKNLNTLEA
jgi:hypothetical protein